MNKGLEALDHIKTYSHLDACKRCQYYKSGKCENNIGDCLWKDEINIIEKSLKALEIIKKLDICDDGERRIFISGEIICKSKEEYYLLKEVLL